MGKTAHADESKASKEIYALAKADAELELTAMREEMDSVRIESQAAGALQAIETTIAFQEMLKAITLQRIKQSKEYKAGGLTWDSFCESLGLERRTVDRTLDDLRPLIETFSDKMTGFCGMPFSKIRLLGRQISDNLSEIKDNCLIYGDEQIPLTPDHVDDIQALIERVSEEAKAIKEDAESRLKAKDKVLKAKEDLLNKQEKMLRKFDKDAAAKGVTVEEDAFLQKIDNLKMSFDGYLLKADPAAAFNNEDFGEPTPRMRAALISMLHYMKMQALSAYDTAITTYGGPAMNPELLEEFEKWQSDNN